MKKDIIEGKVSKGGINRDRPKTQRPPKPNGQGKKTAYISALKYNVEISDSALDRIHGFKYNISEIFIPEANLAFNEKGGIFTTKTARLDKNVEDIEISKDDVQIMEQFLTCKQECLKTMKKYYPQIET